MTAQARTRSAGFGMVAVIMALLTTACGNRLPHEQIRADALGTDRPLSAGPLDAAVGQEPVGAGIDPGAVSDAEVPAPQGSAATGSGEGNTSSAVSPRRPSGGPTATGPQVAAATPGSDAPSQRTGEHRASSVPGEGAAPNGAAAPKAAPGSPCVSTQPPIAIGIVGYFSGVGGPATLPGLRAIQAWVQYINDGGGLACHPIRLRVVDDGSDPARNQAAHRQMVEQDGVVAFIYSASPIAEGASIEYLKAKKVPTIGQVGGADFFYDEPYFFNAFTGGKPFVSLGVQAAAKIMIPEGKRKLGLITCQEVTFCNWADEIWSSEGQKLGFEIVSRGKGSLAQPDFTAQCLAAKNAGAQTLMAALGAEGVKRLKSNCESVGLKADVTVLSANADTNWTDESLMDGTVSTMPVAPWFDTSIPGIREMQEQMKRYAPNQRLEAGNVLGWTVAKTFEHIGRAFPPGELDSAAILRATFSIKNDAIDGLTYPLTFVEGQKAPRVVCGWAVRLKGGQWSDATGFFCK